MAEKKKQHKVGERFTKCGIIYEVRESNDFQCDGCALIVGENVCSDATKYEFEACDQLLRDDHKDIIFAQVGEAPEGAPLNSD